MFNWHMVFLCFGCAVIVLQTIRVTRHWRRMPNIERRREAVFLCWYSLLMLSIYLPHQERLTVLSVCINVVEIAAIIYWLILGGPGSKTRPNGVA